MIDKRTLYYNIQSIRKNLRRLEKRLERTETEFADNKDYLVYHLLNNSQMLTNVAQSLSADVYALLKTDWYKEDIK